MEVERNMTGQPTSASNMWSCDTLGDGLKHVIGASRPDDEVEEEELLRQLKDSTSWTSLGVLYAPVIFPIGRPTHYMILE